MTIERLRCFAAVAEQLNFTRAAEKLHMAQTAMSRQIAALEEELNCRLFERSNRMVRLTPAGERFWQGIGPMLAMYDETLNETRALGHRLAGELRVGIGQYEGGFVSELVREFHQSYPLVEVMVTQHSYKELLDRLTAGALDVAFALPVSAEYLSDQKVELQYLFSSRVCIAVWKDHPLAGADNFPRECLEQERLLTISEDEGACSIENLNRKLSSIQVRFKDVRQMNSLDAALLMVRAGFGVAIVPEFLRGEVPEGVVTVSTDGWNVDMEQFVAFCHKGPKSSQVEAFWNGIACSHTLWEQMEQLKER